MFVRSKHVSPTGQHAERTGRTANDAARHLLRAWIAPCIATLAISTSSYGESRTGSTSASASLDFRITIPAIIRVTAVTQPETLVIDSSHLANGYIDLDAGTTVRLTVNTRKGYQLSARYDGQLLSAVDVRIGSQQLTATSGFGGMRVSSGLMTDKLVPISYRLHLAPGTRAGQYRWPVALAFSLTTA